MATMENDHIIHAVQPLIHSFSSRRTQAVTRNIVPTSISDKSFNTCLSYFILIPSEDKDGNHRELLQKVYAYPQGTISTVYEKPSPQNILKEKDDQVMKIIDNARKENFCIKKKGSIFGSSISIVSGRDSVDSVITHISGSPHLPVLSLSPNINLDNSQSFNYSKSNIGNENFSDNSSVLSSASNLSFYDEEYAVIKKAVSDIPFTHHDRKSVFLHSVNNASQTELKFKEQNLLINSLQLSNKDLKIKLQRISMQFKKIAHEKATLAQQLEIFQTKILETSKNEYFQGMKDKGALEGQYEALKLEHKNCFNDENLLKVEAFEFQTELFEKKKAIEYYEEIQHRYENLISELENKNLVKTNEFAVLQQEFQNNVDRLCKLELDLEANRNYFTQNEKKLSNAKLEIISLKQSNERLQELSNMHKNKEDLYKNERINLESKISESYLRIISMKDSQESLQTEFVKVCNYKTDLQRQLSEAQASLSTISTERDQAKAEMEKNMAMVIIQKSSYAMELEEIEAEMRDREVAKPKCDDETLLYISVNKERFKKLEDVFKRFQTLKIKMAELQGENEVITGEIKHKKLLQNKNEYDIRELNKELVVTQEKLTEKELAVISLNSQLQETKFKLKNSFTIIVDKENLIAGLKEEKLELITLINIANEDKQLVDNTILKLKEDMNKLTANHFHMKHDIVAKDRQIKILEEENSNLSCLKLELLDKLQNHKEALDLTERNNKLEEEVNSLNVKIKMLDNKEITVCEKIKSQKEILEQFRCESKCVDLCHEQIDSLQLIDKTYADKLQDKNREISPSKDRILDLEKDCQHFNNEVFDLKEKIANLQRDEDFSETQILLQKSIEDLKANLKMEILSKNLFKAKHKKIQEEFYDQKDKFENQVAMLKKSLIYLKNQLYGCKLYCENNRNIFKTRDLNFQQSHKNFSFAQGMSVLQRRISAKENKIECLQRHKDNKIVRRMQFYLSKTSNEPNIYISKSHTPYRIKKHKLKFKNGFKFKGKSRVTNHCQYFEDRGISSYFQNRLIGISVESKTKKINTLSLRISELIEGINTLKSENGNLNLSMDLKNKSINLLQMELNDCKTNMLLKTKECHDWKLKYEGLCDFIPQRDSNIKQAVALHHSQFQIFNNNVLSDRPNSNYVSHDEPEESKFYVVTTDDCKLSKSQSLNIIFNEDVADPTVLPAREQLIASYKSYSFSETLTDREIIMHNQVLCPPPIDVCQTDLNSALLKTDDQIDYSTKKVFSSTPNLSFEKKINDLTELLTPQIVDIVPKINNKLSSKEDEILEFYDETSENSRLVTEFNCQLEQKEFEFQNKQRQYASNIRLLTRKLKEHMKARRENEKDIKAVMQESRQKLECEEKRYNLLKERIKELGARNQQLHSEKINSDNSNVALRKEIDALKNTLDTQLLVNSDLQRNNGHFEELKMCLNDTKSRELLLETENKQLTDLSMKLQEKLQKEETEKHSLIRKCNEFSLKNDLLRDIIQNLNEEILNKVTKYEMLEREIADKLKEASNLNEKLVSIKEQLDNSNKLKDDIILSNNEEIKSLQFQLSQANKNHSAELAVMNTRIINATEIENSLNEKLKSLLDQKLYYQNLTSEFRATLNCALSHLRNLKRPVLSTPSPVIPSPSPLDNTSLLKLLEKCSGSPSSSVKCLSVFTERLSALREEIASVQQEFKTGQEK